MPKRKRISRHPPTRSVMTVSLATSRLTSDCQLTSPSDRSASPSVGMDVMCDNYGSNTSADAGIMQDSDVHLTAGLNATADSASSIVTSNASTTAAVAAPTTKYETQLINERMPQTNSDISVRQSNELLQPSSNSSIAKRIVQVTNTSSAAETMSSSDKVATPCLTSAEKHWHKLYATNEQDHKMTSLTVNTSSDAEYEHATAVRNTTQPGVGEACEVGDMTRSTTSSDEQVSPLVSSSDEAAAGDEQAAADLSQLPDAERPLHCPCAPCADTYVCPRQFAAHVRLAHGRDASACAVCGGRFSSTPLLDCHVLEAHSQHRPFGCRRCGERLAGSWSVRDHRTKCPATTDTAVAADRRDNVSVRQVSSGEMVDDVQSCLNKRSRDCESSEWSAGLGQPADVRSGGSEPTDVSCKRARVSPCVNGSEVTSRVRCSICGQTVGGLSELIAHNYRAHSSGGRELLATAAATSTTTSLGAGGGGGDVGTGSGGEEDVSVLACDKCSYRTASADKMQQHEAQHKCSDWISCMRYQGVGAPANITPPPPSLTQLQHGSFGHQQQQQHRETGDLSSIRSMLGLTVAGMGGLRAAAAAAAAVRLSSCVEPTSPSRADRASTSPPPQYPAKDGCDQLLPALLMTRAAAAGGGEDAQEDVEDASFDDIRAMKAKGEFPCRLCDHVFPNLRAMKGHNRVHMAAAPYDCNVCVFSSSDKATLVRHMKQHNGERPYECRLCRFAFTTKANCERHLKNRHQLRTREQLNEAMFVHATGEGAMPAPKCSAAVAVGGGDVSISAVSCAVCGAELKQVKSLKEHMRVQHRIAASGAGFACAVCDTKFADAVKAADHVKRNHLRPNNSPTDTVTTGDKEIHLEAVACKADLSSFSKQLSLSLAMPPTMVNIPNMTRSSLAQSPSPRSASPTDSVSAPAHAALVTALSECDNNEPVRDRDIQSPQSESVGAESLSARESSQEAPLDLSVKLVEDKQFLEPQTATDTAESAAAAVSTETGIRRLMTNPFGLYMPYAGAVPFFVMPGMLGYPTNEQWRSALSRQAVGEAATAATLPPLSSSAAVVSRILGQTGGHGVGPMSDIHIGLLNGVAPSVAAPVASGVAKIEPASVVSQTDRSRAAKLVDSVGCEVIIQKPKQRRYRTQRPFSCCHCEARFTLSTNMDRHIKNHHPDKWERKSRGARRAPSLSAAAPLVAGNYASSGVDSQHAASGTRQQHNSCADAPINNGYHSEDESRLVIDEAAAAAAAAATSGRRDEDMVSVSRLVDSAQAQNFQQYFGGSGAGASCCEDDGERSEEATSDAELSLERRRSAYSSAPNKIPCRVCRREFPWTSSLRRHELTHSGEKPFRCPRCLVTFTTKSNCDRHMVRKHNDAGVDEESGDRSQLSAWRGDDGDEVSDEEAALDVEDGGCQRPESTVSSHSDHGGRGGRRSFWCHVCCERWTSLQEVRDHVRQQHDAQWRQLLQPEQHWVASIDGQKDFGQWQVYCMVCGCSFPCTADLSAHMSRHVATSATYNNNNNSCTASQELAAPAGLTLDKSVHTPERAKKRDHLNDISARLSAASLIRFGKNNSPPAQQTASLTASSNEETIGGASGQAAKCNSNGLDVIASV